MGRGTGIGILAGVAALVWAAAGGGLGPRAAAEPDGQGRVQCYFRPEDARPFAEGEDIPSGFNAVPGVVTEVEYRGDRAMVTARADLGEWDLITSPEEMERIESTGGGLRVGFAGQACRGFSSATSRSQ